MIMRNEYLEDMKEHIQDMEEDEFARRDTTREAVLGDRNIMERLWTVYQKDVEDYDCDPDFAKQDAVDEVLGPRNTQVNPLFNVIANSDADSGKDDKKYVLLSWNDEWLDIELECAPTDKEAAKQIMREIILERLVELGVTESAEEARRLYEQASNEEYDNMPYELHVESDGASIYYGSSYEERYQINEYNPKR